MFERYKKSAKKYSLAILAVSLLIIVSFIFYADWQISNHKFTFAMLDVGQGDALFIESPTGVQILLDGGPPGRILSALTRVMPPFDRTLDAIVVTNPDQDHIGGFSDILKIYKIGKVFEPGTINDSKTYQNLEEEIKNKNIPKILAKKGMKLHLGGGAVVDILFPDRDVSLWDTNEGSVVARLAYGGTSIMLMGDSTVATEKIILGENSGIALKSSILKVGHHGSRTSTSDAFVKVVAPAYAFISDGKDNKYGHPHKEVLHTLERFGVKVLRTDTVRTIVFSCARMGPCKLNYETKR